ncbi:MAG: hypothetical protein KDA77_15565, partial [Planctomycetaceae bacterium]|nr:hypothetical protein [Planctomycetaceae bacterium]
LRSEVKRIVVSAIDLSEISPPAGLLDIQRLEDQLIVTVDGAAGFVERLSDQGIEHEVVDLCLDEIFEAFVIGRTHGWPQAGTPVVV